MLDFFDPDWEGRRRLSAEAVQAILACLFAPDKPRPGTRRFRRYFERLLRAVEADIEAAVLAERDRWAPSDN